MAGGYFHLPVSRRPSDCLGSSKTSPVSPTPSNTSGDGSQGHAYQEPKISDGAQGPHRNASILKSTNRVKFTVDELELKEPKEPKESSVGHSGECRLDPRGSSVLPQKPLPTADIPRIQDSETVDPQRGRSAEQRSYIASPDVTGLTIDSRTNWSEGNYEISSANGKGRAISYAQERAQRLASLLTQKPPKPSPSSQASPTSSTASTPTEAVFFPEDGDEVPMISFPEKHQLFDELTLVDDEAGFIDGRSTPRNYEASSTVRQMSGADLHFLSRFRPPSPGSLSGRGTPSEDRDSLERPRHNRGGILSSILKLYDQQSGHPYYHRYADSRRGSASTDYSGRGSSPDGDSLWKANRPKKWYEKSSNRSSISLTGSSIRNFTPVGILKRSRSTNAIEGGTRRSTKPQLEDEIRITVHIAELLQRQRYLIRLCRALMKYGAPTHRLEEYMRMTARVLEIDGQFLYIPGCMIVSFDDASTHTTEVKVVRSSQGIDLGKLADVHEIYKEVIHDVVGVEEAIQRLDETMKRRSKYHILFLIFAHGCASASVGPFAFNARPIDMPVAFLLGCLLGVLQLILTPKSSLYSNVFEISAAVMTSFLARAFGSIRFQGESFFCFSALAQSSIALILPGYTVLCASLELQSRSIVAGSVRMVYAIIYSLFLGFGITIGTAVYGLLDPEASTAYTCPPSPIANEYLQRFPFVLIFTACLAIVNHAKWKQLPVMLVISFAGYVVSYFSSKRFYSNTQVSNALGAFVIGIMGNCYSRFRHGLAAAAMLPAIFVLVPSGLAASGSLISGITSAEEMTRTPYAVVTNGTQGFVDAAKNLSATEARNQSYGVVFDIGYGMVQVAIGTTVGLFLAALVVYPLGKKRSGLFSF